MKKQDSGHWNCRSTVRKYHEDITPFKEEGREAEFDKLFTPYEVIEQKGNCLLNTGIDAIWDLVMEDDSTNYFTEAETYIAVGDATVAANATQTDIQATANSKYVVMYTSYPTTGTQAINFKASFGAEDANFDWEEWAVFETRNNISLNRKVESLGTKTTGTWTLEVSITLS